MPDPVAPVAPVAPAPAPAPKAKAAPAPALIEVGEQIIAAIIEAVAARLANTAFKSHAHWGTEVGLATRAAVTALQSGESQTQ